MHDRHLNARGAELVGHVLGQRRDRDVAHAAHRAAGLARRQAADIDDAAPGARMPATTSRAQRM
jgi:hypothetical protein